MYIAFWKSWFSHRLVAFPIKFVFPAPSLSPSLVEIFLDFLVKDMASKWSPLCRWTSAKTFKAWASRKVFPNSRAKAKPSRAKPSASLTLPWFTWDRAKSINICIFCFRDLMPSTKSISLVVSPCSWDKKTFRVVASKFSRGSFSKRFRDTWAILGFA